MTQHPDDGLPEPPRLRRLRWLVTALTVVLMLGVLAIAATIVIRLGFGVGATFSTVPVRAKQFQLPAGAEIVAVGRGAGTVMFVLRLPDGAEALHLFDETTGAATGRSLITRDKDRGA
jgi:hypothetical protein